MRIDKSELTRIANAILTFMDEKKLNSLDDIEPYVGHKFIPDSRNKREFIEISVRTSNLGTKTLDICYISEGKLGVPLNIKINKRLNYSTIILKVGGVAQGYNPFWDDGYGNFMQEKRLQTTDMQEIKKQLQNIPNSFE